MVGGPRKSLCGHRNDPCKRDGGNSIYMYAFCLNVLSVGFEMQSDDNAAVC